MDGFLDLETLGYFLYMQEQENKDTETDEKEAEDDDLWISQNKH